MGFDDQKKRRIARAVGGSAAALMLFALGACAGTGDGNERAELPVAFSRSASAEQPFPANYRPQILEFLRTYLNDPTGVRDPQIAEPEKRTISGSTRYVSCLRYSARDSEGRYGNATARMAVFVDGRFDSFEEKAQSVCASAAYRPFPELGVLKR